MELTQEQRDRIAANRAAALKIRAARLEAATAAASLGSGKQTNLLDHSFSRAKGTGPGGWVHDNSAGTAMGTKPESLHDTSHRQEIIEFSCVVLNARTLELGGRFQQYVKPTEHPLLTRFCMELTHITQDRVDKGLPLAATLEKHDAWLRQEGLVGAGKRWVPVTWSDWDFKVQMEMECKWRGIPKPAYFQRWIDLRQTFSATLSRSAMGLKKSVQAVGLAWEGRQHSGLDDALNTARLAAHLIEKGAVLAITGSFTNVDASGRFRQATLFPNMPQKKHRIVDANGSWTGKCECGVKAQQRRVNRPGVHHGRMFYGCGTWTITKGGGCNLLKWFSDVTDQERKAYAQC
ncbi:hypothetical protein WJX72_007715 [[Myrmecia] bisecta]|uniref:GRF-type domain-containing protein n=1 Tax=[Myrmecia] bisecta TaxID=41462 RepID=A0AAW1R8Q0_9CHLO